MTYRLFDGSAPDRLQWDGEWVLGPVEHLMLRGRAGKRARERLRREGARRVPGLARGRHLLTVISVVPRDARRRERLRPCCPHAAGLRVVAAGAHTTDACVREADAVSEEGERLADVVRPCSVTATACCWSPANEARSWPPTWASASPTRRGHRPGVRICTSTEISRRPS